MGARIAPALAARVLAWVKRANPASVRAYLVDGESREVALTKSRQKWQRFMTTVAELGFVRLEAYDHKGAMCAPPLDIEAAGGAGDMEDLAGGAGVPVNSNAARELHFVRLLITYGDNLLARFENMLKPMLEANRVVLGDLSNRLADANQRTDKLDRNLTNVYDELGKAMRAAAAKGEEGAGELQQLMAAMPQLIQVAQMLGLVPPAPPRLPAGSSSGPPRPPAPPAPPNGHNKTTPPPAPPPAAKAS